MARLLQEQSLWLYSVSKKKEEGNRDLILNLSKFKWKIMKLLSVDDSIFLCLRTEGAGGHYVSGLSVRPDFRPDLRPDFFR